MHVLTSDRGHRDVPEYREMLRTPDMSVGRYVLPVGATDPQQPHTEDEVYIVLRGRAVLEAASGAAPAVAGSALFVPAGEPHAFTDILEELEVIVVFAPAEHTRQGSTS